MRGATVLLAVLLACGANTVLPTPHILSVSPRQAKVGYTGLIRVSLDAVVPVRVDYGQQEARAETTVCVMFGDVEARLQTLDPDGTLEVSVPDALTPGDHDVRVILADGREARREAGFLLYAEDQPQVETDSGTFIDDGGTADAGAPEDGGVGEGDGGTPQPEPGSPMREGDITAYEFDAIPDQAQGQSFVVTVRAIGPRAFEFEEKVDLSVSPASGVISPESLDQFVAGVCTQSVTVAAQGNNVKLTVTDRFGVQATSNGFRVK
ncbi:hypothetical protein LZ198_10950 [Myxococcus sp. K15C18031901]|uniref:hypothetical protein n=1 Tax=Myxococcus dinghuensis TaxID=2906761 RepID=UPI0020A7EC39|nr:hypothetical protein [Myxococcus dinghuensis]MCP3099387.1 hypothetical protein [Myxococcus dinghuensis]